MRSNDNFENVQDIPHHCVEIKTIESRFTRLVAQCSNQLGDNTSGWLNAMRAASGRGEKFDVHEKLKYMMEKLAEQGFLNRFQPSKRLASKCIQNKPFKKKEQRDYSPWPQTWDPQQQPPPPVPASREVRHWPAGWGYEDAENSSDATKFGVVNSIEQPDPAGARVALSRVLKTRNPWSVITLRLLRRGEEAQRHKQILGLVSPWMRNRFKRPSNFPERRRFRCPICIIEYFEETDRKERRRLKSRVYRIFEDLPSQCCSMSWHVESCHTDGGRHRFCVACGKRCASEGGVFQHLRENAGCLGGARFLRRGRLSG